MIQLRISYKELKIELIVEMVAAIEVINNILDLIVL